MQFLVIAFDGKDEGASARRLAVREVHLQMADKRFELKEWLYASAILNDSGMMVGSMIVCDYPSRAKLDEWLKNEPYVIGDVWQRIEVHRAQIAPFCAPK